MTPFSSSRLFSLRSCYRLFSVLCVVILEALRMRHTPNILCKLCMTGITTALLQVQLLAAQARRSLHFPQLDSLLHEL